MHHINLLLLISFFFLLPSFNVLTNGAARKLEDLPAKISPFTPKAYLIRYWKQRVTSSSDVPSFLLDKASPLTAAESASFVKLADQNTLSSHLSSFCSSAKLFCFPDVSNSLEKHKENANFTSYMDKNFTNYGSVGNADSFKNYSDGENIPVNTFRRYGRDSVGHDTQFSKYAPDTNVADQSFHTYAAGSTGGATGFHNYNKETNIPNLNFNSYSAQSNGQSQTFTSYTESANSGATDRIRIRLDRVSQDTGNAGVESFSNYRDKANVGDDTFQSYGKHSSAAKANFVNYGQSFNDGSDRFKGYGKKGSFSDIGFKTYGVNNTFKDYANKSAVSFSVYQDKSSQETSTSSGEVNKWVEAGKFFREKMLKSGNVLAMPDIRDKMPKRSFLPRILSSKLPFTSSKVDELKTIFHASDNSSMGAMLADTLSECERGPSRGETKRCVHSVEDMVDFANLVLGPNVVVRTTKNTNGSNGDILIGKVKGINGGKITKAVSCHQSLFPYLVYYCHSVPKVRVYEADLLDSKSKAKINHGIAICHIDTSEWSAGHGAFVALGSGPGQIEVCHWIFENDMNWTVSD
ncbi:Polygalacturonase non-catalytic subunit AroGP3 [Heracleum sosnowskyi]|uniref:Polygalacturonase non-catalytic subunit AroGP3 n=1 Tax=Heracleum sosnowskyi TaxID=360622 RepID=A0AAD8NBU2_9APIA|nr:Polygalacturonase non-catalytic subunit AroGP3 [Heracleum sosnowskyi]